MSRRLAPPLPYLVHCLLQQATVKSKGHRPRDVLSGLRVSSNRAEGQGSASIAIVAFRVKPNGFVIVLDRSLVLTQAEVGKAAIAKRQSKLRAKPDGFVIVFDGPLILLKFAIGKTPIVKR